MDPRGFHTDSFATTDIPATGRHEARDNRLPPSAAPLYATRPAGQFTGHSQTVHFGGMTVIYVDGPAQRGERGAATARPRTSDALGIDIGLTGGGGGMTSEHGIAQAQGSAILADLSQAALPEATGGRSIQLLFPRTMALDAGLDVAGVHGLVLDSPAVQLLTSHALRMREALPGLAVDDGPRLARSLLDLLLIAIGAEGRTAPAPAALASTLLARAQREIERNLGSPALTIANLCRRLQVSRSTLHRLFEDDGGVQAYIRNRRLDAARLALRDLDNGERIGAVAERLGFSDSAHLSRLFRRRFGQSPSDCRAEALRQR